MHPLSLALAIGCASLLAAQDPGAARVEREAARRHYAAVEAELRQAPLPADPVVAARRLQVIDHLRAYRERGDYGVNTAWNGTRVPLFVDGEGRRCAVAWLLDRTGHGELTLAIQKRCNEAWVAGLTGDQALGQWLQEHGLTAAEAARIQVPGSQPPTLPATLPPPDPRDVPQWLPNEAERAPGAPAIGGTRPAVRTPGAARPAASGGGATRGLALDAMAAPAWLDWWEWNRGSFELPRPRPHAAPAATTAAVVVDPRQHDAETLLARLAQAPDAAVRGAAVAALGRTGAPADLATFLADGSREVRLLALLALGSGGNAAHAHVLASQARDTQPGETLAVTLAGMSLLADGPVRRSLLSALRQGLLDARPSVHAAAALALAGADAATRRAAARAVLQQASAPSQRAAAALLLGPDAGDDDVAALTALANDKSLDVRRSAALALGRSRHALALPALQSAFELEHENVTQALQLLAIGDHGGAAARSFLLAVLVDGQKPLRAHAALALGLWGRDRDAGDLPKHVVAAFDGERNRDQRGAYLLALGLLRHTPSRDLMMAELRSNANSSTRGAAAAALGLLADRAALPALVDALAGDSCPWVRQQAARALPGLGDGAVPVLIRTMREDKDALVQSAAAVALGGLADARAAAALLAFAADDSVPAAARAGAAQGLGRHFRRDEPTLPGRRFQQNWLVLPAITAWAFVQEL